jgi:hypothetical protein
MWQGPTIKYGVERRNNRFECNYTKTTGKQTSTIAKTHKCVAILGFVGFQRWIYEGMTAVINEK